jgi:hypothetical protein
MDMDRTEALLELIAVALEKFAGRDEWMPAAMSGNDLSATPQEAEVRTPNQEKLRDIRKICNFINRIYENGFPTSYHYERAASCQLRVQPNREERFQAWFSGQWLERAIWREPAQAMRAAG